MFFTLNAGDFGAIEFNPRLPTVYACVCVVPDAVGTSSGSVIVTNARAAEESM